ncbi:predicted protein [Plenodomus lingam JN3]|uniref:Predicted protein n=1 Tax=Leptosphaeria maculans (strain JN3 / isolate v23.1.3 / race Av1-4-5-6-7-8) TaxID=985895 RepID=E4ZXH9_LEPMJ|nr:predicted protein [Plenodomus lingam JN3]CBX95389.1 predicted protein [Plenodomus lingam JN3]
MSHVNLLLAALASRRSSAKRYKVLVDCYVQGYKDNSRQMRVINVVTRVTLRDPFLCSLPVC